jgi:hypothetical protein
MIPSDPTDRTGADAPHLHGANAVTPPVFPPGRYGRRRRTGKAPRWVLPLLVAAVLAAGLLVTLQLYRTRVADQVHAGVTTFSVRSDRAVRVSFEVSKESGEKVVCIVRARGKDGSEVGRAEVPVPIEHGDDSVEVTYTLTTRKRAVTGEVQGCRRA